jgi:outer membrane protein insertion porin family
LSHRQRTGGRRQEAGGGRRAVAHACVRLATRFIAALIRFLLPAACVLLPVRGQSEIGRYDGRTIGRVEIVFDGTPPDDAAEKELRAILPLTARTPYAAVKAREALQVLFSSDLVVAAKIEISEDPSVSSRTGPPVTVRFVVRRTKRLSEIAFNVLLPKKSPLQVADMRGRLTALEPGRPVSDKLLGDNSDALQQYLREQGFFRADVGYKRDPDPRDPTGVRERVAFNVAPGTQAKLGQFNINIAGFDAAKLEQARRRFALKPGLPYSRAALVADLERLRQALIAEGFLAPLFDEPQTQYDPDKDLISINLTGRTGPPVKVELENLKLSQATQRRLLPIKREGTIDPAAIVEGQRRLQTKLQLDGYFFAEVTPVCTVTPAPSDSAARNGTREACDLLSPEEVGGGNVTVTYHVERGRRYALRDIRVVGTDKLKITDVEPELRTQRANSLAFFKILGSRRGFTSNDLLQQDRSLVEARLRDLGHRQAKVSVRQGVSLKGDTLIITFAARPGPVTRVKDVRFVGHTVFDETRLREAVAEAGRQRCAARELALLQGRSVDELPCYPTVSGQPYSRSQARADGDAVQRLYADAGYFDAQVEFSIDDKGEKNDAGEPLVTLEYKLRHEGPKVVVNDVAVTGANRANPDAILRAVPVRPGDLLRASRLTEGERNLYGTDAFRQVNLRTRAVGVRPDGTQLRDVVVEVEEEKPRTLEYGGGYSTDGGPLGFFALRNVNLFGKLQQGAVRTRISRRQQLVRLEYLDPRWREYGANRFMPLSISAQYQRDTTITRFFRSTIDRGSFGIVQRLNENGDPVDELGNRTGEPTINRFTFNVETQRVLDKNSRNIVLLRYAYEDVRLYKIGSLLIADVLRPDRNVRLSRFGGNFYRDTRDDQFEPTKGEYFALDYSLSLRPIGANISFSKVQFDYRRYYRLKRARNTIFAANFTLGAANVLAPRDRDGSGGVDETDRQLPISERFFGGGSTTLRGFGFEEAGPRVIAPRCYTERVILPNCGTNFRDRRGNVVTLNPFTVPIGGNALAVLNLEARVPVRKELQIVPFYDGGNVYRNFRDIYAGSGSADPNLSQRWTHTVGLGVRIKTPFGGAFAVDYGFLLNPPQFVIPQRNGADARLRLKGSQLHFRFTQAF